MFENMTGIVGQANHQARLTEAMEPGRLTRVQQASLPRTKHHPFRVLRAAGARALFALADRLAPVTADLSSETRAPVGAVYR